MLEKKNDGGGIWREGSTEGNNMKITAFILGLLVTGFYLWRANWFTAPTPAAGASDTWAAIHLPEKLHTEFAADARKSGSRKFQNCHRAAMPQNEKARHVRTTQGLLRCQNRAVAPEMVASVFSRAGHLADDPPWKPSDSVTLVNLAARFREIEAHFSIESHLSGDLLINFRSGIVPQDGRKKLCIIGSF